MDEKILIDYKELPAWVRKEMASINAHRKPHAYLHICRDGKAHVGGPLYDWSRVILVAQNGNGETMAVQSGYYDSYLNMTDVERAVYHGGAINIPDDGAVLEYDTHAVYKHLHVTPKHPLAALARRLDAGDGQLDEVERAVLAFYAGYNSRGRKDAKWRYNIPEWLIVKYTGILESKSLVKVNKAGAVTVTLNGKNTANAQRPDWSWYTFSDDKELRSRVLKEARARV